MNDNDRELLELAAKAAQYKMTPEQFVGDYWLKDGRIWNPLDDDDDAFRLGVDLGMTVIIDYQIGSTVAMTGSPILEAREPHDGDPRYATRRAIVRAAAAIAGADDDL